ncbi:glycine C-acetyltransferase [Candidatus Marinimicrobia bacterium]|jgi:glycine C-acetyltransferase|nr:glycine C-acetyltransferase [Candidatus Neomarinimicrobiota bacterium]
MYINKDILINQIKQIKKEGLYKNERTLSSNQQSVINVNNTKVHNFCANNYLGLSNNSELIKDAKSSLDHWGFGLSSVRFICGTQEIHKELESKLSNFLEKEDTILYTSCFDANGGLFETLLNKEDAIISDSLNHASIIDGVRLCKADRFRYSNSDMNELEQILIQTQNHRLRMITTDGVFSMDGYIAKLDQICTLAEKYRALVHVDDSHATGFIGETGKGSGEHCGVLNKIDIITSTLGKALGGASGGFTSAKKEIIDILRQRSRPYLFSNSLAPVITSTSISVINMLENSNHLIKQLNKNTKYFRENIKKVGLTIKDGIHPIIPIMIGDAKIAQKMSEELLKENIYVIGFFFPVVPKNEARIRVQISAAHTKEQLDHAIYAFEKIGKRLDLIK